MSGTAGPARLMSEAGASEQLALAQRLQQQGDRAEALRLLHEAAAGFQALGHQEGLYDALLGMANVHLQMAQADQALALLLTCSKLASAIGSPLHMARSHFVIGVCLGLLGRHAEAEPHLLATLGHARSQGTPAGHRACLSNLVLLHCCASDDLLRSGRNPAAAAQLNLAAHYVDAAERLVLHVDPYADATWRANRAGWLRRAGHLERAITELDEVYGLAMAQGWVDVARHTALGLGLAGLARKSPAEATRWLVRCVAVSEQIDAYGFVNQALQELATQCKATGDLQAAQRHLNHSARLQDALHAERRRVAQAVGARAFDLARALPEPGQPT